MMTTCFFEKLVDFERNTKNDIPEDRNFHNLSYKNIKFYNEQPKL
jgi:hypothetical protein